MKFIMQKAVLFLILCSSAHASFELDTTGSPDDSVIGDLGAGSTLSYPITLAAWVKYTDHPASSGVYMSIAVNRAGSSNDSFWCAAGITDGSFEATSRVAAGGSSSDSYTLGTPSSLDNTWFPIICYLRGDTNREIYPNNATDGNNTTSRAITQALRYLRWGQNEALGGAINAKIAELAIWNSDLSTANRNAYAAGTSADQIDNANLIGYWPLNVNDLTPDDQSGNGGPTLSVEQDVVYDADHPTIDYGGTPAFDSGPTVTDVTDETITVTYDANADADNIQCMVKSEGESVPANGGVIEAQTGSRGYATEATTGSSDTLVIDVTDSPEHPEYDVYCVLEEGTSNYTDVEDVQDVAMDPPSGYQFIELTSSLSANSPCVLFFNPAVDPDIAVGDWILALLTVSPGGLTPNSNLTVENDCDFEYNTNGSQQSALNNPVFDKSQFAYHASDIDFWDNNPPPECNSNLVIGSIPVGSPMTPLDVNGYFTEQNGDTATFSTSPSPPANITVNSGTGEISGTASAEDEDGALFTVTVTDPAEQECDVEFKLYPIDTIPTPNYLLLDRDGASDLHEETFSWQDPIQLFTQLACSGAEAANEVIAQDPAPTVEIGANDPITITVARECSGWIPIYRRRFTN